MDYLTSLTSHLKELLKGIEDDSSKENIIFEHIKHAEKVDITVGDFPPNLEWFNTAQPLSSVLLQGKIVVLDFFTYCCINCLHIIPHLRQLEENFSIPDGLVVVGVHSAKFENEKNSENILSALKKLNISHPVVNDKECFLWDQLEISCWPTLVILGPQRQPIFVLVGEGNKEDLLLLVKVALKFYSNSILPHDLPLITCDEIVKSDVLSFPGKIACDKNLIAVSDSGNHRILILSPDGCIKHKIGGEGPGFKDGSFETSRFNSPQGLEFYNSSKLYVADTENHAIRLVDLENFKVSTVVGNGSQGMDHVGGKVGVLQEISSPWDVCVVPCSDVEVPSFFTSKTLSESVSVPMTLPSSQKPPPPPPPPSFGGPLPPPPPPPSIFNTATKPSTEATNTTSKVLLIAAAGTHQIWAYFIDDGVWWKGKKYEKNTCVAVAGTGKEENRNNRYPMMASFAQPSGLTYSEELKAVFVADSESSSIRKICLKDGNVSHVVGATRSPDDLFSFGDVDGKGFEAKLQHPLGVAWNSKEKSLFVCDSYNHKIKEINLVDNYCKSIHKDAATFKEPGGCCFDDSQLFLLVADTNHNSIKKIHIPTGDVKKIDVMEKRKATKSETSIKEKWEHNVDFPKAGGILSITIEFKPLEVNGTWKLETENVSVSTKTRNGKIDSETVNFEFEVDPLVQSGALKVIFDLIKCGDDSCKFRRSMLVVNLKMVDLPRDKKVLKLAKTLTF